MNGFVNQSPSAMAGPEPITDFALWHIPIEIVRADGSDMLVILARPQLKVKSLSLDEFSRRFAAPRLRVGRAVIVVGPGHPGLQLHQRFAHRFPDDLAIPRARHTKD